MRMFRILALLCFIMAATFGVQPLQAQPQTTEVEISAVQPDVEMADTLRQDGKIYVVVAVLLTIMVGLIVYLISLDRKVNRLEKLYNDGLVNR